MIAAMSRPAGPTHVARKREKSVETVTRPKTKKQRVITPTPSGLSGIAAGEAAAKAVAAVAQPRESATLCYCFPDGSALGSVIKLLQHTTSDGNFHFGPDAVTFARSDAKMLVLNLVRMWNKHLVTKGDIRKASPDGFFFGVRLNELATHATNCLTKYDAFLLFFEEDNARMVTEQINSRNGLRNLTTFKAAEVHEFAYADERDASPHGASSGRPDLSVPIDLFCTQLSRLVATKSPRVVFYFAAGGLAAVGRNAAGEEVKRVYITPTGQGDADGIVDDALGSVHIEAKTMKILTGLRNIAPIIGNVDIYFEGSGLRFIAPIRLMGEASLGEFETIVRDEGVASGP